MMLNFIMVQHDLKNRSVNLSGTGALSLGIWARESATSYSVKGSSRMRRFCGVKSSMSHLWSRVPVLGGENRSWKCCCKDCCFSSCNMAHPYPFCSF